MREFLIRRSDGEWFDLHASRFAEALRPTTMPPRPIAGWGDHRNEVDGEEIAFSHEDPGIQAIFETGKLAPDVARRIDHEISERITLLTGRRVVEP
ncbi:MAG: hypothetical protein ACXW3M_13070 [Rhodoplanes sp.]